MREYSYEEPESANRGSGDFVMGVLAGAAVGAAIALLYAPVRGREAREMLSDRFQKGMDRANQAIDRGRDLAAQGKDLAGQGREFVSNARETVTQAIADGREAYRRTKQHA